MKSNPSSVLLVVGADQRFLGDAPEYRMHDANVGLNEIQRMIGRGKDFGTGALTRLIRACDDSGIPVIHFSPGEKDSKSDVPWIENVEQQKANHFRLAGAHPTDIDIAGLQDILSGISENDDLLDRVLVAGCHTEVGVQEAALLLKSSTDVGSVAVCAHAVASSIPEAHYAALRHSLPRAGIEVHLSLDQSLSFLGAAARTDQDRFSPCEVAPPEVADQITEEQLRLVQELCLHWSKASIRPLAGGFSGSLLLLARGLRGAAATEPMVLKIDNANQMRRELSGYYQVKDFLGKHVPAFGYPVRGQDLIGVSMELAAMEGRPATLQDAFEEADSEQALQSFLHRLQKSLRLLSDRLYANTRYMAPVAPYRTFGLHAAQQLVWLEENASIIVDYAAESGMTDRELDVDQIVSMIQLIVRNEDRYDSEVCTSHGDLNLANVISDEIDNVWFIDWTHCSQTPIELDFAKLENDVKFVMSKDFEMSDAPRIKLVEEYLTEERIPAPAAELPARLRFARWDLRFKKILDAVRVIREACFALKQSDEWLTYRIGLLRYAMHTLSFDKRRDRGECEPVQLLAALYSVSMLGVELIADDFNLRIRGERPASYPERLRISIDEAPWGVPCPEYDPPYYVAPEILNAGLTTEGQGWAHPEEYSLIKEELARVESRYRDEEGRPLNPRGRTGIAGRGLLGLWGENLSTAVIVTRSTPDGWDILLGSSDDMTGNELPKGFLLPSETPSEGVSRILAREAGCTWSSDDLHTVSTTYTYDPRQTDHAWVSTLLTWVELPRESAVQITDASTFDEVHWWPISAEIINTLPSTQAALVREFIASLDPSETTSLGDTSAILART